MTQQLACGVAECQ